MSDVFAGMRPLRPAATLRERVLAAAGAEPERPVWWRAWGFGPGDLAWVATALVLMAVHIAMAVFARPGEQPIPNGQNRALAALAHELGVPESALRGRPATADGSRLEELLIERIEGMT